MNLRHNKNIKNRKTKRCYRCQKHKKLTSFYNNKRGLFGKSDDCKTCHSEDAKIRRDKNKNTPEYKQKSKLKYQENKEYHSEQGKKYYKKNKKKVLARHKKWRINNKEKTRINHKNWYENNRELKLRQNAEWEINQIKNNPAFKIKKNLRSRLSIFLRGKAKYEKIIELLGCDLKFLKKHIEKKFKKGMTWDNYGSIWHVDHIIPCAAFDLTKKKQQEKCFHYSNLQPLFSEENLKKSDKIIIDGRNKSKNVKKYIKRIESNPKSIRKKSIKTNLGEIFNSITEASLKTGVSRSCIRRALNGLYKTSAGRKWYYR